MNHKIHIVADENIPKLKELIGDIVDITFLPGRNISAQDLLNADVLLVRSITKVNATLLTPSLICHGRIKFVGSCTIGTDHVDLDYLAANNITFANAPGCNAAAVVDYVIAALMNIFGDIQTIKQKTVGIVGIGQVGGRLRQRLQDIGVKTLCCDPFKPEANATLAQILSCDVISLHVPLTKGGEHKTHHLIGKNELNKLKSGSLLINSSRGSVIDNAALMVFLSTHDLRVVLDVFEDEPTPEFSLLEKIDLATPHIAGYSLHGKIRGTVQVVEALLKFFNFDFLMQDLLTPLVKNITLKKSDSLTDLLNLSYDIFDDSKKFQQQYKTAMNKEQQEKIFDAYRKNYPVRYESAFTQVLLAENSENSKNKEMVKKLGFRID